MERIFSIIVCIICGKKEKEIDVKTEGSIKRGERVVFIVGPNGEEREVLTRGNCGSMSKMLIVRDGNSMFAVKKWRNA